MGSSHITGLQTILFADNASYDGTERGGALSLDGQLWIGSSSSPHVVKSTLTAGSGISITNTPGNILITNTGGGGGGGLTTLMSQSGAANESGGVINVFGSTGISTSAGGMTLTITPANDLAALEALSGTGFAARTGSETWALRTLTAGSGISITNPQGIVGSPVISADANVPTSFTASDATVAFPSSNNINLFGAGSITTTAGGSTVTTFLTGLTNHAVLVASATPLLSNVGPTAIVGQVLQSAGLLADPAFSTATYPLTTAINEILYSSATDTVTGLASGNKAVLTSGATGIPVWTALNVNGQLIIGSTGGVPAASTLTAGTGITITNASNSITIAATTSPGTVQTLTGNTGGPISPTGNNINIVTANATPVFAGSGSTLTLDFGLSNLAIGSTLPSINLAANNVFMGELAGTGVTDGGSNIGIGRLALFGLTTGTGNTAIGLAVMGAAAASSFNAGFGDAALENLTAGDNNTAIGANSLLDLNAGDSNSALGYRSLWNMQSGSRNIAIGFMSGQNLTTTESSNILIGNDGILAESNAIHIGTQGAGAGQQNKIFAAGIVGTTVTGNFVNVKSDGQLGEVSSGAIGQTITGDSGGALTPSSGNWNILGRSGSKTSGSGATLTIKSPPYANQAAPTTVTLNSGSFATAAITLTTPASAGLADGDLIEFVAVASPLIIQFSGAQVGHIASSSSTVAGAFTSTAIGNTIMLRYQLSTDDFWATSVNGNWIIT
jgi:hypothetical protein